MIALLRRVRRLMWVAGMTSVIVNVASLREALAADAAPAAGDTQRVVSIGGDVTEIIFALGLGDRIVAVDTTSHYPPDAVATKKSVGYMRALSSEGVLSMSPSLIIASENAGPPEVVAALKSSSIRLVDVRAEESPDGVARKITFVSETLGAKADGEKLASRVRSEFDAVAAERAKITKPIRALFILSTQGGRVVVAGSKTSADAMFKLAGAENAVTGIEGYKPLNDEAAVTAAPDVIVAMLRSDRANAGRLSDEIAAMKGLGDSPAAKAGRILEVDGSYVLQFGPRAASAASDLMHSFYPDLPKTAQK